VVWYTSQTGEFLVPANVFFGIHTTIFISGYYNKLGK